MKPLPLFIILAAIYSFIGAMDDLRNWDVAFGMFAYYPFEVIIHLGQFIFFVAVMWFLWKRSDWRTPYLKK